MPSSIRMTTALIETLYCPSTCSTAAWHSEVLPLASVDLHRRVQPFQVTGACAGFLKKVFRDCSAFKCQRSWRSYQGV